MAEQEIPPQTDLDQQTERLVKRARFLALVYRIILAAGLLLSVATAVLIFITRRTYLWVVVIPLGLITLGVLLARFEYNLDLQLYSLENQEPSQGED